jgi:hypothetical protein
MGSGTSKSAFPRRVHPHDLDRHSGSGYSGSGGGNSSGSGNNSGGGNISGGGNSSGSGCVAVTAAQRPERIVRGRKGGRKCLLLHIADPARDRSRFSALYIYINML